MHLSANGKWIYMQEADAYVNINAVVYVRVCPGPYVVLRLVDNKTTGHTVGYDEIKSTYMTDTQVGDLRNALMNN